MKTNLKNKQSLRASNLSSFPLIIPPSKAVFILYITGVNDMTPIKRILTENGYPSDYHEFKDGSIHNLIFSNGLESWVGYFMLNDSRDSSDDPEYYFVDYATQSKDLPEDIVWWGFIDYKEDAK